MNKEQWKQELSELKLTDAQKMQLKQRVNTQTPVKKQWQYRVALPAFIVLALFCIVLWQLPANEQPALHSANPIDPYETDHFAYLKHVGLHIIFCYALLLVNSLLAALVIMRTTRWQSALIMRIRKWLHTLRFVLWFITPIVMLTLFAVPIALETSIMFYKWLLIMLILLLETLLLLYFARNIKAHIACPHCQTSFTNKERRKYAIASNRKLLCKHCQKSIYISSKYRNASGLLSVISGFLATVILNIGIPFIAGIVVLLLYTIVLIYYIFPLYIDFKEKEEFLW